MPIGLIMPGVLIGGVPVRPPFVGCSKHIYANAFSSDSLSIDGICLRQYAFWQLANAFLFCRAQFIFRNTVIFAGLSDSFITNASELCFR